MRFDSARAAGLDEEKASLVDDGYATRLPPHEVAALKLTDALINMPAPLSPADAQALKTHYGDAEIVEMALAVGLFLGMSKVLITLGLEPEQMPVTVIPTPGS